MPLIFQDGIDESDLLRTEDATNEPDADEVKLMDDAFAEHERQWTLANATGLSFVPGCICCGSNTPELIGRCPCRGIDLRAQEGRG